MAVYTHITREELEAFLGAYDLGALVSFAGIEKGVSNSNYHVFTQKGRYILTLFEERRVRSADLPFFFAYAGHLKGKGIACPAPVADRGGNLSGRLAGRAACLLNFLDGEDIAVAGITPDHCAQVGALLARMHKAAEDFTPARENSIGITAWRGMVERTADQADGFEKGLRELLRAEIDFLEENWPRNLPSGAVHADVFPDNVFFSEGTLCAVIDFYFACTDFYAFDLAVAVNAWCFDAKAQFDAVRFDFMLRGYRSVRDLSAAEEAAFPVLCRGAVLRTLVSRLEEFFAHDPAKTLMTPHDPGDYLRRLRFHHANDMLRAGAGK